MKTPSYVIFLILMTILVLSACGTSNKLPTKKDDIFKGSEAIQMNFIVSAPPAEVYEEKQFRVGIDMKNIGAYYPARGYLLIGYEEDYLKLDAIRGSYTDNRVEFELDGRTLENPYGSGDRYFFNFIAKTVDKSSSHHLSNIFASACYEFQTKISKPVCIDTDVYKQKETEKVCQVKDISLSDQGAPVAIKKIEYDIIPIDDERVKPTFKIYVENIGNGKVLHEDSVYKACSSESLSKDADLDFISMEAHLGSERLTCSPTPLHLQKDIDFVRCSLEEGISANLVTYQSFLEVDLAYGYMQTISREVDIKPLY